LLFLKAATLQPPAPRPRPATRLAAAPAPQRPDRALFSGRPRPNLPFSASLR
jgi:hypothetical protein